MPRKKGKKPKTGDKMIGQPSHQIKKAKKYSVPSSLIGSVGPAISEHESTGNIAGSHSGFIFMCNSSTKLECYQYRVFGLPSGMKDLVEVIKPGTKLFLFDFQLKLLYGVYEATSAGTMNLEPAAFSGRFPAQVKFKIFKECLPLPENSLRHIIRENYTGTKFKQNLSGTQVTKLLSSFRPLTASLSSSQLALEDVPLYSHEMPSTSTRHHQFTGRLPSMGPPYLDETRHSHIPPFVEPQCFSRVNDLPHDYHRASTYVERVYPAVDLQSLTRAIGYYVGNSEQPAFTEGVAHGLQGPSSYSRYLPVADGASNDQVPNLSRSYLNVPVNQVNDFERRYQQQFPLQRESALVYQDNAVAYNPSAPSLYNNTAAPSVTQPQQVHTPHHGASQYQDNNTLTHSYNPPAAAPSSSEYTALSALYQINAAAAAAYNSCSAAPVYDPYSTAPPSSDLTAPSSLHQNGNGVVYNSTQYGIEASGVYGNSGNSVAYAPPAAQVQVSSLYYSHDSGNHQSQR